MHQTLRARYLQQKRSTETPIVSDAVFFQFHNQPSAFRDNIQKVNFTSFYLCRQALQWFEPIFSRHLNQEPAWFDNWEEFVQELETNLGPYDDIREAENELTTLKLLTG
jgi:hypothetical protein